MTDKEKQTEETKQPIDMTSDELLDYALAPEIAEALRKRVRGEEAAEPESEGDNC